MGKKYYSDRMEKLLRLLSVCLPVLLQQFSDTVYPARWLQGYEGFGTFAFSVPYNSVYKLNNI